MTANPALSLSKPSGHPPVSDKPAAQCTRRIVGGVLSILLGLCITAYSTIGTLFMAGAVQQRDPSVRWIDVGLELQLALGGVALLATGIVLVAVCRNMTASMPPPLVLAFATPARQEA